MSATCRVPGVTASSRSLSGADTSGSKPTAGAAIDGAIDEIGRIADPHKAIDWLSTFPQVVLLALGETP